MTVLTQEPVPDDLLPFGWVDCGVIDVVGDDTSDDDQDPGSVPVVGDGLIVFIPKVTEMRVMRNGRSTLVRPRPVPANLDQFDFELTGGYTLASPAPLWHLAPYDPPDGVVVTTMEVPSGQQPGQVLGWDGAQLVWVDAGSGGGGGSQGPQGVSVVSITDTDGDGIATVTLHDPKTGADSTSALPLPRGVKGDTPATPMFTASATTLAAGSAATASVSGTYPALTLALGIPRGADGSGGSGGGTGETDTGWVDLSSLLDPAQLTGSLAIRRIGITVHLVGRLSPLDGVTVDQRTITISSQFIPKQWGYSQRTLGGIMNMDRGGGTADTDAKIMAQGTTEECKLGIIKLNFVGDVDITWTAGDAWPAA